MTGDGVPPVDQGNRYLAPVPCDLSTSRVRGAAQDSVWQELAVLTVRAGNATVTVMLTKDELAGWIQALNECRDKMTGLLLGGNGRPG